MKEIPLPLLHCSLLQDDQMRPGMQAQQCYPDRPGPVCVSSGRATGTASPSEKVSNGQTGRALILRKYNSWSGLPAFWFEGSHWMRYPRLDLVLLSLGTSDKTGIRQTPGPLFWTLPDLTAIFFFFVAVHSIIFLCCARRPLVWTC